MSVAKRISALVLAAVLIGSLTLVARAHPALEQTKLGSLTLTMQSGTEVVSGGSVTLYRVGDAVELDGDCTFALLEQFQSSGASVDDLESVVDARILTDFILGNAIEGETQTVDEEGRVTFSDLAVGLYLVVQHEAAEGYQSAESFFVSIPQQQDGAYLYEVDATPKVALAKLTEEELTIDGNVPGIVETETPEETPAPTEPLPPEESAVPEESVPPTESFDLPQESASPAPTESAAATVTNKLPQTGQLKWPIPVLVFSGLTLIAAGWILWTFGKEERYEA